MWILIIMDTQLRKVEVFHSLTGARTVGAKFITGGYVDDSDWQPMDSLDGTYLQNSNQTAFIIHRSLP
jgi:hypothetical protein